MQLRALVAEFIGTAFLLAGGAGSGIMAERLSNDAGMVQERRGHGRCAARHHQHVRPVSGAHFKPVVTLSEAALGTRRWADVGPYIATQTAAGRSAPFWPT